MPSTIINGVDLYYEYHGKGKPLMLVQRFRVSGVAGLVNTNHFHKAHFSISLNQ